MRGSLAVVLGENWCGQWYRKVRLALERGCREGCGSGNIWGYELIF